ncbi:MAG: hypothetical protein IKU34_06670 [Clostridia bacterium]|nr:hypothetical protein [Clostridia bacterium]
MIQLFPGIKKRMTMWLVLYMALVFLLGFLGQTGIIALILFALVGIVVIVVSQYSNANKAHEALLGKLYNNMDAEGFIKDYEPLLGVDVKHPNLYMMIRLHLSNAYCALGRFDDAIDLLSAIPFPPQKKEEADLIARYTVSSNLCYCALLKHDVPAAQRYMNDTIAYKKRLEAIQETKPKMQRMVFSNLLNEQCLMLLTSGKCDAVLLRDKVQVHNTQMLHRVTTGMWIARALLADNNRREAVELFERIAKVAGHLHVGQEAKAILAGLPGGEKTDAEK